MGMSFVESRTYASNEKNDVESRSSSPPHQGRSEHLKDHLGCSKVTFLKEK